jgi:uncharacterized protein
MIRTTSYLGIIASILVLCQWFALLSIRRFFFQKKQAIRRILAYPLLIGFGLITIVAARLEFGSEMFRPGTFGRQLASILVFSYLGWVVILSLVFLFVRAINSLIEFSNAVHGSKLTEAGPGSRAGRRSGCSSECAEEETEQKAGSGDDRVGCSSEPVLAEATQINPQHLTRRAFLKVTTASSVVAASGLGFEGIAEGYSRPIVERYDLSYDLLEGAARPVTLVHVTDWHFGMFFGRHQLRDLVDQLNSLKGDALCITGDVFHSAATPVEQAAPFLKKLKARPLGNYAVLGNHDFYAGTFRSVKVLEEAGITLLRNQWITIGVGNSTIHIGGVDDPLVTWMHRNECPGFNVLMSKAPLESGVHILLSHRPGVFHQAARRKFDLVLSGHTHGGQIVIPVPGTERGVSVADMVSGYTRGWYKSGTSLMYLNRGVGFTFLPWRIHCPPEIALIQLSPGNKGAENRIPEEFLKYGYRRI